MLSQIGLIKNLGPKDWLILGLVIGLIALGVANYFKSVKIADIELENAGYRQKIDEVVEQRKKYVEIEHALKEKISTLEKEKRDALDVQTQSDNEAIKESAIRFISDSDNDFWIRIDSAINLAINDTIH